ncbi:hypothetical protein M440DRAFT_1387954 [Trichoderma longibrachiatum ATCC 18648]|uniref:Uncharacterized protein n=1 Tax=Trichoderma longibrachiatum ATCC 18648 TaxID=983965 RepID=A0A2T4CJ46_TRILO|nr:hypothetical protein M440DRAFT_1387954 [Trichoderma longibrachiatum ATCC 18648]
MEGICGCQLRAPLSIGDSPGAPKQIRMQRSVVWSQMKRMDAIPQSYLDSPTIEMNNGKDKKNLMQRGRDITRREAAFSNPPRPEAGGQILAGIIQPWKRSNQSIGGENSVVVNEVDHRTVEALDCYYRQPQLLTVVSGRQRPPMLPGSLFESRKTVCQQDVQLLRWHTPVPRPGCLEPVCSVLVRSIVCRCQRALAPASKGAAEILPQAVDAAGSASSFGEGGKRSFFPLGLSSTAILDAGGVGCQLRARAVWASGIGMELNAAGRKETGQGSRASKQSVAGQRSAREPGGQPLQSGSIVQALVHHHLANHPALPAFPRRYSAN